MLALASNPAEAKKGHKHEARPKATPHAQVQKHHKHQRHAHYAWVWKWRIGYYDIHGHWIHGKWVYSKIII